MDESSLLAMVAGQRHLVSTWKSYAERIATLLTNGLPVACKSVKPKHEPHLQEICDGILRDHDNQLLREFPFLRWGSTATKPDWSAKEFCLWIELKYVREKLDLRPITEAIAADITKYGDNSAPGPVCGVRRNRPSVAGGAGSGDNEARVLYVVYDPQHFVTDERAFAARRTAADHAVFASSGSGAGFGNVWSLLQVSAELFRRFAIKFAICPACKRLVASSARGL